MKKIFLLSTTLVLTLLAMSQDVKKQKEVGISFYGVNDFGLTFKTGTNKTMWRFNTIFMQGSNNETKSDSLVENRNSIGFGVKFGKEYRKNIVDNLEFRYGVDLSFSYNQSKLDENDNSIDDKDRMYETTTYRPGVNLVFGLNYVINDNFVIGAELLPRFDYVTGTSVEKVYFNNDGEEINSDISGFNYGLGNTSALLTLAYRF